MGPSDARLLLWYAKISPHPPKPTIPRRAVLLVDETSIRRRHRYVTVVACGESGKVLAMIPGRIRAIRYPWI